MTLNIKTPGVYIEEVTKFPPSIVAVETAVPAFIGYTEQTRNQGEALANRPVAIDSQLEFEQIFGLPPVLGSAITVTVDATGEMSGISDPNADDPVRLAHAVRHFYDNGGGRCYIVSVERTSTDTAADTAKAHLKGLAALAKEDEPTLIVFPDLSRMAPQDPNDDDQVAAVRASYHSVLVAALAQCAALGDRFLICDLWDGDREGRDGIDAFRNGIGTRNLKYGAVYHPFVHTTLPWHWDEDSIKIQQSGHGELTLNELRVGKLTKDADGKVIQDDDGNDIHDPKTANTTLYASIRKELDRYTVKLPPAAAVAGVYATVDRTRGVWKAPANESLAALRSLTVEIDKDLNDWMNVHPSGKSINAIRAFTGKGFLVWGARTLAGNDNEWRYVPVRRFFNMVEESTRKAIEPFVFEPNDANTWTRVKAMVENFLTLQWRQGALAGAKPEDAFYVQIGLGETMTAQDILEGRMNVEIGMAVVRPAEFIVLRFSHKMQES